MDEVKDHVDRGEVMRCGCGALVKPDIVFFGENLPARSVTGRRRISQSAIAYRGGHVSCGATLRRAH